MKLDEKVSEDIFSNMSDGYMVFDKQGEVVFSNPTIASILENSHFTSFDEFQNCLIDIVSKQNEVSTVQDVRDFCAKTRKVAEKVAFGVNSYNITILTEHGGAVIFKFEDITSVVEANKEKREFTKKLVHKIRTPLGSTRWYLEMLINGDMGEMSDEILQTIQQVYRSNFRLIIMANNFSSVSKIEQNELKLNPTDAVLDDLLKSIIGEFTSGGKSKEVIIEFATGTKPCNFQIDQDRFRDVMNNLINNSISFSTSGKPIKVILKQTKKDINIEVRDNGIGIPLKEQKNLFEKYFRASNAIENGREGPGLGLYIVKNYVEMMGGEISFESKEGSLTKFVIHFDRT